MKTYKPEGEHWRQKTVERFIPFNIHDGSFKLQCMSLFEYGAMSQLEWFCNKKKYFWEKKTNIDQLYKEGWRAIDVKMSFKEIGKKKSKYG